MNKIISIPETPPLYPNDHRLEIAIAALRLIAIMPGYSPESPNFRVVAQTALKDIFQP